MKQKPLDFMADLKNWRKFKKEMCDSCIGLCCYNMPVEVRASDLLRMGILTDFEMEMEERDMVKEALKHPGVARYTRSIEKFTLSQKIDTSCYFLDSNGRCTVYDKRPDTCREHPEKGPKPGSCAYYPRDPRAVYGT